MDLKSNIIFLILMPYALSWQVHFKNSTITLLMNSLSHAELILSDVDTTKIEQRFHLQIDNPHLARVIQNDIIYVRNIDNRTQAWSGYITVYGSFLGNTNVTVHLYDPQTNSTEKSREELKLIILRPQRFIDHAFIGSVILLMSLLFINFGAALDVAVLRSLITRPVGPIIGYFTQFMLMPMLSYGLGLLIFPKSPELQLGLFFTGISPSGGASNTWCVILGGNITLSVLMTTLSNLAAFVMMPLWIFTLGKLIFDRGNMIVPYIKIGTLVIGLIVPLAIGLTIQRSLPRLASILVRLMKPISMCLILFIVVFAIATNYYIFELFSWQIAVAGFVLPSLGYLLAWLVALTFRQNRADALTIAIETGIQNTGIAIFLLSVGGLPQPQADLTTVVPVSVAIMTPLPLFFLYLYKRCVCVKDGLQQPERNLLDN